jgi:hypothetical protein
VDRCALFVDAGYMLADGAMAVHGTRRRESVSWDYEGLMQLLGNLARDRTGLPLLRCYWYEATVEGRRSAEHEALADMPGIKLRLAKLRPGRREGVETEIHRDLTVLASNHAVSDAVVVSAEEDLAQVLSDVQDLGMRVTIVHVTVDGNWTISRSLRQECDDIMELTSAHLRPYVELIPGAEPARADEQYSAGALSVRSVSNGHSNGSAGSYHALPPGSGHSGPPSIYTAPVVAEYQRPAQPVAPSYRHEPEPEPEPPARDDPAAAANPPLVFGRPDAPGAPGIQERIEPARPEPSRSEPVRGDASRADTRRGDLSSTGMRSDFDRPIFDPSERGQRDRGDRGRPDRGQPDRGQPDRGQPDRGQPDRGRSDPDVTPLPISAGHNDAAEAEPATRQDIYGAPVSMPFRNAPMPQAPAGDDLPSRAEASGHSRSLPLREQPGLPGPGQTAQSPAAQPGPVGPGGRGRSASGDYAGRGRGAEEPSAYGPGSAHDQFRGEALDPQRGGISPSPGPFRRPGGASSALPLGSAPDGPGSQSPAVRPGSHSAQGALAPGTPAPQGPQAYIPPQNGPYSGPQSAAAPGRSSSSAPVSLTDAVQSAHEEGKEFGESVAREAPALWLEAVLARKPRMPSDLEARLLQGSALPIDFLLHDEVRHALRRGFWDALESTRR